MAHHTLSTSRTAIAAAALLVAGAPVATQSTDTVTITGRAADRNTIGGFGDQAAARSPLQALTFGSQQLGDSGVGSIAGLTRLDASVGDAYNAEGYWSILSARGYTLDNRFNYRRDSLPINAETAFSLDNKERLELLKGTSGIQAGSSAPGGLVNLVVKRPSGPVRSARLEWRQSGSMLGAVDIGDRFGPDGSIGLRLNAAVERLDPTTRDTVGHSSLFALAADWKFSRDSVLEIEFERSRQTQPSVVGFSLLGQRVPDARDIDPRLNLNHQPWSQPVVMNGDTASLRWQQQLAPDWRLAAHAMTQRLKSDDRTAFPYGVYNADYECPDWCDRFAPDGTFTYWQYISDNERRRSDALDVSVSGKLRSGGLSHSLQGGVLLTRYRARFDDQIFDIAGPGRIDGTLIAPASAGYLDANTNRDERSTEWYLRDAVTWADGWSLWAGLRHTRLQRQSVRTSPSADGLRPTDYDQAATIPWLALARELAPHTTAYLSWGQGLESDVVPNRARYSNRGEALPALKSRQFEAGIKHSDDTVDAALTYFDIDRPQAGDVGPCDEDESCTRAIDGSARHRGVETLIGLRQGDWHWQASAMWLNARRRGSSQSGVNGLRPVNVPRTSLRMSLDYRVPTLPGLDLQAAWVAEGNRTVLPDDDSLHIAGWSRLDLGTRWRTTRAGTTWTWRVGVDNALDRRAWKESPYQFGHVYLYPLAPRTWRTSMQANF